MSGRIRIRVRGSVRKLFPVIIKIRVSVSMGAIVRFRDVGRVRVRVTFRIMVRVKVGVR